ncbi:MAG: glutaredoxin 3 [Alphaproteobacteria bacterium]|nr:glutaredoxin 3 [Alphaproteobacteria bacterium]
MANVEVYASQLCPYCHRAKKLLTDKGAVFQEYNVDADSSLRATMRERAGGCNTVPQIFIDGRHIGGCDDLYALDGRGGLDPLLGKS